MRRRTKLIVTLLLLAVIVGWPVIAHYRAKNKVAQYRQQLASLGEKMTIAELTPVLPRDSENGANRLVSAVRQAGGINWTNHPPTMRFVIPGRALVAWRQKILPTSESTNLWPSLRDEIEAHREVLAEIRDALGSPALVFNLDYSQGFGLQLSHLLPMKQAAQWLSAATVLDLHEGRVTNAVENVQALTALVRHYQNEPFVISSLVRIAIAAITVNAIWETLQSPGLNDEQLAGLQANWERVDFLSQGEAALSMERVLGEQVFDEMRTSRSSASAMNTGAGGAGSSSTLSELMELGQGVLDNPRQGLKEIFWSYPGYWAWEWWWSYGDELVQMQYVQSDLLALREARTEDCFGPAFSRCKQANQAIKKAHPKAGSWFDYGLDSAFQTYLPRLRLIEIQRRLLVTAIALKRFQMRHGHYPESLTALVPEFCRETPRDPTDGQPLRYRVQSDGSFLLYSIGENGVDDGGDPSLVENNRSPRNWTKGRDMVWPQPASAQGAWLYELEAEGARERQQIRSRIVVTNDLPTAMLVQLERLMRTYHFTLTNSASAR